MTTQDLAPRAAPDPKPLNEEIDAWGLTHPGKVRTANQDHFLLCSLHRHVLLHRTSLPDLSQLPMGAERLAVLAMVADGVGGTAKGEEASRLAVQHATRYVADVMRCYYMADAAAEHFIEALEDAASHTHAAVAEHAAEHPETAGMATTLTVFLGVWPWIYVLQVGDSRYYILRDGELTQVTRDQTMAEELVTSGVLTRTQAFRTRWASVLSSSIGGKQTAPVVTRVPSDARTVHLMCSDGLTKHVPDDRIRERLATMTSAQQACEALLEDALEGGGTDNITIIVGRVMQRDGAVDA
jgi:protein phosphatase